MSSQQWSSFEHLIWKNLTANGLNEKNNFVLAVSGGLDSMVLLEVMLRLKPKANFKVIHYHHGVSGKADLDAFRENCLNVIRKKCEGLLRYSQLKFVHEKADQVLLTEDACRRARWGFIKSQSSAEDVVLTAHHLDDRLETILLKLLRGSSLDGVASFKMWNGQVFRPFLNISKLDLLNYAENNNITWVEDPSNSESDYLRNWIRNEWLRALDQKLDGGRLNLAKSLIRIADEAIDNDHFAEQLEANVALNSINRSWYLSLSRNEQLRCLALILKRQKVFEFTSGHLEEIRKRLDKNQKELTFELLGIKWVINATQVVLQSL